MQTRRDLYQAHRLMVQRVGLALIQGEPDVPESPMRRSSVAAFSGVMVALLVAAIAGVWGLISHDGATGIEKANQIIIEKETGTKYIWDAKAQRLDPVANYASAVLALGGSNNGAVPSQKSVSRDSLKRFRRGPEIGIPGAPDSLPDKNNLVSAPWSVCVSSGTRIGNIPAEVTTLLAGQDVSGKALSGGEAIIVQWDGRFFVIWNNQRMLLAVPQSEILYLNHGVTPPTVTQAWLTAIPQGHDYKDPEVPDRGKPITLKDGSPRRAGQVFFVTESSGAQQYYLLLADGSFSAISATQEELVIHNPGENAVAYPGVQAAVPIKIDGSEIVSPSLPKQLIDPLLPPTPPTIQPWDPSAPLCVVYPHTDQGRDDAQLTIGGTVPAVQVAGTGQGSIVDQVLLPPGKAAVIGQLPGSGLQSAINTWLIVNDQGLKYPASSADVIKKLGYDVGKATPVPARIVALIPSGGATLDLTEAACPISQNASCPKTQGQGGA